MVALAVAFLALVAARLPRGPQPEHKRAKRVIPFWQAENWGKGVYQAGDLSGLRHVGLMTGCLRKATRFGRTLRGYVPEPEAITAYPARRPVG